MNVSLRRLWLRLHRWIALGLGWLLVLAGLTGATLIVAQPLDRQLHPELFVSRSAVDAPAVPLEPLRERAAAEFGAGAALIFRLPREPGDTLQISVKASRWIGTLFVDPATGQEQGRRSETGSFAGALYKLHSTLLMQDTGKTVLAFAALAYLFMLVTGLVLWWPRQWPPSLKVELRRGLLRGLFDLHRTGGALLGLLVAVSVFTGAYMAWRPLGEVFNTVSGQVAVKPPKLPKGAVGEGKLPTVDQLLATARVQFPGELVNLVQLSPKLDRPVRVRFRLADEPHPNGISSVWLDPRNGRLLGVQRWSDLDPGARSVVWIYPMHTGELGGPLHEALNVAIGLALGCFGVTGLWLWWKRRRLASSALAR
ncbi:PepSY domain-containing protein [Pelomonas sp. KK5]|uniref:PepSY-associated TM helix domain-containing protein n=1 Tax=Pelomonas sp. KK5 TaxID=1855730 RepID=UPI00097CBF55|nr:PepSY-associated TM helix domain-containing protein [Pelomonas sp. KK5]